MQLLLWLKKLLSGFCLVDGQRIGKVIYIGVWIILGLTAYHKLFFQKQSVTNINKPQQVIIQDAKSKDLAFVGLKLWWIKIGVSLQK